MSPRVRPLLIAMALPAGMLGCDFEPDVGPPIAERCSDGDTDPTTSVSFARDLAPILLRETAGCAPCHDPSADGAIGFQQGGLDVTTHASLLRGGYNSKTSIVKPGKPCDSAFYLKVSPGPPFGSRMPLDGPPFLSGLELRLVHDWIAEGAKDD